MQPARSLNNFISAVSILRLCEAVRVQFSDPYKNVGKTKVSYIFKIVSVLTFLKIVLPYYRPVKWRPPRLHVGKFRVRKSALGGKVKCQLKFRNFIITYKFASLQAYFDVWIHLTEGTVDCYHDLPIQASAYLLALPYRYRKRTTRQN